MYVSLLKYSLKSEKIPYHTNYLQNYMNERYLISTIINAIQSWALWVMVRIPQFGRMRQDYLKFWTKFAWVT